MSLFDRLFGRKPPNAQHTQLHTQMAAQSGDHNSTRRELLRVVLRDTLTRHGVPASWIGVELLTAASRTRQSGIHMRLQLKHWDPRLLPCMVAFQKHIAHRVELYDPLAPNWLMGISWQFALEDESQCPEMPDPSTWKPARRRPPVNVLPPEPAIAGLTVTELTEPRSSPPARKAHMDRKAELEKMFAQRDAEHVVPTDLQATQPLAGYGPTQPATL